MMLQVLLHTSFLNPDLENEAVEQLPMWHATHPWWHLIDQKVVMLKGRDENRFGCATEVSKLV